MPSLALRRSIAALELLNRTSARQNISISANRLHGFTTTRRSQTTSSRPATASSTTTNTADTASKTVKPSTTSTTTNTSSSSSSFTPPKQTTTTNISQTGLSDSLPPLDLPIDTPAAPSSSSPEKVDWSRSFHGISDKPFPKEIADILLAPPSEDDVEIKPDGIIYLPEIKYRRILNRAFGPGGWGLVPRGESIVTPKTVTREYALICHGRLVSIARGEQDYFNPDGVATATEGCKSNALVRCCKDLGIASELWDPRWVRRFKAAHTKEVFVEHAVSKKRSKIWIRKDEEVGYPWKPIGTK